MAKISKKTWRKLHVFCQVEVSIGHSPIYRWAKLVCLFILHFYSALLCVFVCLYVYLFIYFFFEVLFLTFSVLVQINNAGSNAYSFKPLAEASDEDLMWVHIRMPLPLSFWANSLTNHWTTMFCREVVSTNTLGLMICCREVKRFARFHMQFDRLTFAHGTVSGHQDDAKSIAWWSYI